MQKASSSRVIGRLGLILCVLPAAYFFCIGAYAFLNADDYASDLPRLLRYALVPLVIGGVLVFMGSFLRPENRLMIGLIATSVLLALFAFETVMTLRSFAVFRGIAEISADAEIEETTAYHGAMPPGYTIKALNKALAINDSETAFLSGLPGAEVLLCTVEGKPVVYTADRYGFRNPDQLYDQPTGILVLGDSFAEGICLPDGQDVVSQIRQYYPATINTGSRGSGPLFELAILQRWGPELEPPLTLFFFFEGNDWQNLVREHPRQYLREYLLPSAQAGSTTVAPEQADAAKRIFADWWREYHDASFYKRRPWVRNFLALQQTASVLGLHYPKGFPEQPEYEQILRTARATTESWNGRVAVVFIPVLDRYIGLFPSAVGHDGLRFMVKDAADSAGVDFIDLTEEFAAAENPRGLYQVGHFSAAGASLAADIVYNALGKALGSKSAD